MRAEEPGGDGQPVTAVGRLAPPSAAPVTGERFDVLHRLDGVTVEQITSSDRPDSGVQRQGHDEWVLVLDGRATVELDGVRLELTDGDHVLVPAGTPHRVLATTRGTRWLAVHVGSHTHLDG